MVRAHDVFETVQAVRLTERIVEKAQGTNVKEEGR